jgi:hypothetical protein
LLSNWERLKWGFEALNSIEETLVGGLLKNLLKNVALHMKMVMDIYEAVVVLGPIHLDKHQTIAPSALGRRILSTIEEGSLPSKRMLPLLINILILPSLGDPKLPQKEWMTWATICKMFTLIILQGRNKEFL